MRESNKTIPRAHTVMPTLDDIIHKLNGATMFSRLDLNHGYHQLELKENLCDITTSATHVGLYRYKRLNFGTKSSGEIFQDTVSKELTCDIPGCINISDDILVFGKGQEEHDQCLEKLFKRAREKGMVFNKDKCECNKDRCLYYGMVFSKEGASPDPAKVEAIKEVEPLCNAKEFHSFLCTVQYNAQFIESYTPVERAFLLFTCVFNTFGIPEEIKSDNGPLSTGLKFSNVAQEQGFFHCKVTIAWAEANGYKECFMQTLKKSPKIARLERKPI